MFKNVKEIPAYPFSFSLKKSSINANAYNNYLLLDVPGFKRYIGSAVLMAFDIVSWFSFAEPLYGLF